MVIALNLARRCACGRRWRHRLDRIDAQLAMAIGGSLAEAVSSSLQ